MFRMLVMTFAAALSLYGQWCPPGAVRTNPAPIRAASAPEYLMTVLDAFSLNEETEKKVEMTAGGRYWLAANGCPKMGKIRISVVDSAGKVLKQAVAFDPHLCFTAPADGTYTIKVKALSLIKGASGTIDARLSTSRCTDH